VSDTSRPSSSEDVDLDTIERDLRDVETALNRLADGTYWIDEVTGAPIPEQALVRNPMARRA
jgi:RNA polymerase-binding transcription factor DksA